MREVEIPDTGERMIPDLHHEAVVYAEHLVRYLFAARFVAGKRVLDVASGVGYGADLLKSAGATEVVALDRSSEAVRYGTKHHCRFQPGYVLGDAESLPLRSAQFDVVVSFETIEHVSDYQRFLVEVKRALRQDGLFIVSTPNRGVFVEGNQFHTKEFTFEEFEEALASRFPHVQTFFQDDWIASAIFSPEEMNGADKPIAGLPSLFKAAGKSPAQTLYMVSLCSEAPLPEAGQEVVLTSLYEMRYYLQEIARRDTEIEQLRTELSEQSARLAERDALLENKERALAEVDALLAERDAVTQELSGAYQNLTKQMDELRRSSGYRLLAGYRRVIGRLFPPDSLRGRPYRMLVQGLKAILDRFGDSVRRGRPQR